MARKYIRKFMVVMMELLLIVIHFEVQANDIAPISFYRSSIRIPIPCPSKLDNLAQGSYSICLRNRIKKCGAWRQIQIEGHGNFEYVMCIGKSFIHCLEYIKIPDDPTMVSIVEYCIHKCLDNHKEKRLLGACLLECVDEHTNES
jgi:hypothetical protein